MMYLMLLVLVIVLCLVLKISSRYLFIQAGLLIILHPLLLAKGQISAVYQLSIVAFLLFLSALIIDAITKKLPYRLDEQDSFIVNVIKKNINIRITGVTVGNHYIKKNYIFIVLVIFFIFLFWKAGFAATGFSVVFLAFVANKWDSRIIAGLALICLSISPLLLFLKNESLAETFAVYTYYFLALFVIMQIVENRRDNKPTGTNVDQLNSDKEAI